MSEPVLAAKGLTRRYGGLAANSNVTIDLHQGKLHALLGPNGAGKTTLINLLSGDVPPSEGQIFYKGRDIAGLRSDQRSRLGIGRSYQKTNIFPSFTAFENARLAAQSRRPHAMRILSDALGFADSRDSAQRALEQAGLAKRADVVAGTLSHGEQRQLEIAMVLATDAQVLLLDEPLAGTGAEEARLVVDLLKKLTSGHAILLVEHDMDAVFAVANVVTVMVNGQVLETGSPEQIRASEQVQTAYLGHGDTHHE
jgi:branched-chain amino acid transport system ATP-binding protein